jgi:hypothetical protein
MKHGSWLNMAEIELSTLVRQRLDRRIPDKDSLIREVKAWEDQRNSEVIRFIGSSLWHYFRVGSYFSKHHSLQQMFNLRCQLDIATNLASEAIGKIVRAEAGSAGVQVWCIPDDHPKGWEGVIMNAGVFSKPC